MGIRKSTNSPNLSVVVEVLTTTMMMMVVVVLSTLPSPTRAQSADIEVRMDEERAVGSVVLNVSEYPALFLEVQTNDRSRLTFNILDKDSFAAAFFSINSSTGVISVARRLDRETACGGQEAVCSMEFNVAIQGSGGLSFSTIASVKVYVDDINDNAPTFPADQVEVEVSEVAKVGYVLKLSGPQDPDSPPNNTIQRYELTLGQPRVFSVSPPTMNPDGSTVLNLRLERELDRETTEEYDFNIIAYDGGSPPKSDFLRVVVKVTDDNDNAPVFESRTYTANVREDAVAGTEVIQVRATDRDAGAFGTVRYRISTLASQNVRDVFAINATTGGISLKSQVSPGDTEFSLVVEAFDGGDPPSVAQAVVTVQVLNTGNSAPVVRIVTVSEGDTSEVQLAENSQLQAFVAFVNVDDRDEGPNGQVACSMLDSDQFSLQPLPNKGYQVRLARPVDREVRDSYDAAIVCRDQGSPPLSTQADFTVIITDINDNDPRFTLDNFSATVAENNAEGQYLLQISARDLDAGDNARLTYAILESEAEDYLTVHAQSGVVRARVALDREVTPMLRFTLTATDSGQPARTGTAGLTITITDVNDNSPQLLHVPYLFEVSEGASPGHVIANMAALDMDQGVNGEVEFFFAGSVSGEVPFAVHTNGTVTVSGVLDRETTDNHIFTVLARDRGAIPRSNSTQVTVRVTDINDNEPVILFPTSVNHSVVITTMPEQGVTLGRVIAYDVDQGNSSALRYTIEGGGEAQGVFDIHPDRGEIFLADLKRLKNPHIYQVVLRVYDRGPAPLFAETSLQIEVHFPNVSFPGGGGGPGSHGQDGEDEDKARDSYVVIVGVIGGATLVLSGIIIGAILFVLRSERRKPCGGGDGGQAYKNDYVPAPTGVGIGVPMEAKFLDIPKSPEVMRSPSHSDISASGLVLSPNSLPHNKSGPEVQKKVSFSFDEPEMDGGRCGGGGQMHSQEMLLVPLSSSGSSLGGSQHHLQPYHHQEGAAPHPGADASNTAWKRVASPDDLHSDTSGDSATSDSGRGASDDDIHLDSSVDRHATVAKQHAGNPAPPLTNTNRTPAPGPRVPVKAQANFYTTSTFPLATFRPHPPPTLSQHDENDEEVDDDDELAGGEGEEVGGPESFYAQGPFLTEDGGSGGGPSRPSTGSRQASSFYPQGGYNEGGRSSHSHHNNNRRYHDTQPHPHHHHNPSYHHHRGGIGGKVAPAVSDKPRRSPLHHHAESQSQSPHPFQLQHPHQMGPVVSLHPDGRATPTPSSGGGGGGTGTFWLQNQGAGHTNTGGSRRSLDTVENRMGGGGRVGGGGGGGAPWPLPPRCSSSLSYQQGSHVSGDDDAASTTTSGSYTLSPDELRGLDSGGVGGHGRLGGGGGGLSHDVIV